MNHGQTVLSLYRELDNMHEQQVLQKIKHFSISLEIFEGNYHELMRYLETHNASENSIGLMAENNRKGLHVFQKQIIRCLHNFTASALSLIDHTRNLYRGLYHDNNGFPDYQNEIDLRFKNNPLSVFVKDLRQYIQHYRMPGLSSRLVISRDATAPEMTILLPKDTLLQFSSWHALSKVFIEDQSDDINLIELIKDYHELIEGFYDWFMDRQNEIHEQDCIKVEEHKDKIRRLEITHAIEEELIKNKSISSFENELCRFISEEDEKLIIETEDIKTRKEVIISFLEAISITRENIEIVKKEYE